VKRLVDRLLDHGSWIALILASWGASLLASQSPWWTALPFGLALFLLCEVSHQRLLTYRRQRDRLQKALIALTIKTLDDQEPSYVAGIVSADILAAARAKGGQA
jgi:hypothetical protein